MNVVRRIASVSDRMIERLTKAGLLILAIGIPVFGVFYYLDQRVDAGPKLVDRQVAAAEAAVRKQPGNIALRIGLAQFYQEAKQFDGALGQYDEILKGDAKNKSALLGRGHVLVQKGDDERAAAAFQQVIAVSKDGEFAGSDSQLQEAYYNLASVRLEQGQDAQAVQAVEAALRIDPTDADAFYLLGTAAIKAGQPARAVVALRQATRFVPTGWCPPYEELTRAYTALGRAPQAAYASGMTALCQERPAEARRLLEPLVTGPVAIDAMTGLGMVAESAADPTVAPRRGPPGRELTWPLHKPRVLRRRDARRLPAPGPVSGLPSRTLRGCGGDVGTRSPPCSSSDRWSPCSWCWSACT
jgi:cytochrome c-type biogenesis protein CcmH/NrfG